MSWTVVDASNQAVHCEDVGATTVVLTLDGMSTSFVCDAYGGRSPSLAPGNYTASLQLLDAAGHVLSQTDALSGDVANCGATALPQVTFAVATTCTQDVSFTWSIVEDATNAPLTCATVNSGTVRLNLGSNVFSFDCTAGEGMTAQVTEGTYPTSLQLFDLNSNLISQTPTMSVVVPHCAGADLGDVVFGVQ
ncbi:MAG TPA: hypothetical protein VGL59_10200 [Polyangia bacterium]